MRSLVFVMGYLADAVLETIELNNFMAKMIYVESAFTSNYTTIKNHTCNISRFQFIKS